MRESRRQQNLADDGVVGPLTTAAIELALQLLGQFQPSSPAAGAVRPITEAILGEGSANHLVQRPIPRSGRTPSARRSGRRGSTTTSTTAANYYILRLAIRTT